MNVAGYEIIWSRQALGADVLPNIDPKERIVGVVQFYRARAR